jgi:thiamine kinase
VTNPLTAAAAVARIPGVEPAKARYRALGGGLTSSLWLVEAEDRRLVLRLDTPHAQGLGLDRRTELVVLREAGRAGLAPEVVCAEPEAGLLVYEYVRGRSWTEGDLASRANLEALADLLRRVHALPRAGVTFDARAAAERYVEILEPHAEFRVLARRCRDIVAGLPPPADPVCCHNDVVAQNVIASPGSKLIDWEYACDNDPLFDLASLIAYHDLDASQADAFLGAYAGSAAGEQRERLDLQLRLFDALQWPWLAIRETVLPGAAQRRRLEELAARLR